MTFESPYTITTSTAATTHTRHPAQQCTAACRAESETETESPWAAARASESIPAHTESSPVHDGLDQLTQG